MLSWISDMYGCLHYPARNYTGTAAIIETDEERRRVRSTGLLYGGDYAYDVELSNGDMQRLAESNLSPVSADAAKAGGK